MTRSLDWASLHASLRLVLVYKALARNKRHCGGRRLGAGKQKEGKTSTAPAPPRSGNVHVGGSPSPHTAFILDSDMSSC